MLGADHHGYVGRMRAALAASGADPDRFEALIMQLVHVVEGGERAQMSKRRGEFVTLDELIDDIGVDAARFFMLQRSHDTDRRPRPRAGALAVAGEPRLLRPVRARPDRQHPAQGRRRRASRPRSPTRAATLDAPAEPSERALVKRLLELPDEVRTAAELRAPHRLCAYAMATAADFHAFYRDCQVVGAEGEGLEAARLAVCVATKRVIARTLDLLGVSAPERM